MENGVNGDLGVLVMTGRRLEEGQDNVMVTHPVLGLQFRKVLVFQVILSLCWKLLLDDWGEEGLISYSERYVNYLKYLIFLNFIRYLNYLRYIKTGPPSAREAAMSAMHMKLFWNTLKVFLKLPWNTLETPLIMKHPWNILEISSSMKLSWNILETSLKHP